MRFGSFIASCLLFAGVPAFAAWDCGGPLKPPPAYPPSMKNLRLTEVSPRSVFEFRPLTERPLELTNPTAIPSYLQLEVGRHDRGMAWIIGDVLPGRTVALSANAYQVTLVRTDHEEILGENGHPFTTRTILWFEPVEGPIRGMTPGTLGLVVERYSDTRPRPLTVGAVFDGYGIEGLRLKTGVLPLQRERRSR